MELKLNYLRLNGDPERGSNGVPGIIFLSISHFLINRDHLSFACVWKLYLRTLIYIPENFFLKDE